MLSEEAAEQQQERAGGSVRLRGARGCHGGLEQHPAKQARCMRSRYPFFFPPPTTTTTKWEPRASRKAARGGKEAHLWRHSCRRGGSGAQHGGGGRDPAGGPLRGTARSPRSPRHGSARSPRLGSR